MPRNCLNCNKELIVGKTYNYTDDPEIYEVEIHVLCSVCNRIEDLKKEKKELNKKVRELTKRQKNLEEIKNSRIRRWEIENEYLDFLKSQE
jgi:hypothetical protein